jgi:N6-L-threonylcarbamoyladenine synthase
MNILAIETSCDETSAAVSENRRILSNIIATQKIHEQYGGVVPEFASRSHLQQLMTIIRAALRQADRRIEEMDAIAVTYGPGLAGSLLVGLCAAKGLALTLRKPLIGVNHIEGHLLATEEELPYPYIGLVASGGHTLLILVKGPLQYEIIGRTIDDAAGEAFDKTAKLLGLGYPGGPNIEAQARRHTGPVIAFPRALAEEGNLNFSFSGLKTAVLYHSRTLPPADLPAAIPAIAAGFQQAVIDVLIRKSLAALQRSQSRTLVLAGGVIRNNTLREQFIGRCRAQNITLVIPDHELCTDNAGMIARAGYLHLFHGRQSSLDLDVAPNLSL